MLVNGRIRRTTTPAEWALFVRGAELCGTTVPGVVNKTRMHKFAFRRQMVMWLMRRLGCSYPKIGDMTSRDHQTVIYGCRIIQDRMALSPTFAQEMRQKEAVLKREAMLWRGPVSADFEEDGFTGCAA